jgi:ABC-type nitrate/sulfonate/bicarbonate transport system permease component
MSAIAAPRRTPPRRTLRDAVVSTRGLQVLSVIAVLSLWEVFGRQVPLFTSYPSAIVGGLYDIAVVRNELLPALAETMLGLVLGYAIAAIGGILLGYAMALSRVLEIALDPYVSALYSTPRIVLVPLMILWLGIGLEVRVAMAVLTAIFPIIINTFVGVKSVDRELLDTGRSFTASRWQRIWTIQLPASLPLVFTGLRIGITRALEGVVIAEMTAAVTGTGALLLNYGRFFQTDKLMGPVIVLGLMSITLAALVRYGERRLAPWALQREES